jgi:hypothetical protein
MLNSELCQIGMTNHNMNLTNKEKKLLHTEITMIEYDENVVYGLGQAHRCGWVKIVTDEKNNTDI